VVYGTLTLGRVQTLVYAIVERQWTSNVVREKAMSSHLLLAHVGKFVIVSTAAFHDLNKALCNKNTFFNLSWPIALKESKTASINSLMLFGAYSC
jgi:ferric iron reductase protein FhuF